VQDFSNIVPLKTENVLLQALQSKFLLPPLRYVALLPQWLQVAHCGYLTVIKCLIQSSSVPNFLRKAKKFIQSFLIIR
jgi:hypothetical protein